MPKTNFNFVKSINRSQGISLHELSKFQQQLDSQRLKTLHQKQIFKKQVKLSKQNQAQIVKSIQKIQKQALMLTNKCEQQKNKHEQLQILVKKLEQLLYQQKLIKYQDVINKKQPDEYQQQKKIEREHQKILQNVVQKLNASSYQITKKVDQIRMLRSQRSVFSVLFDKLERQYYDVQFYYKQLAIQRSLVENIYQKYVDKWNQLQTTSQTSRNSVKSTTQKKNSATSYQSPLNSSRLQNQSTIQPSRIQLQNKYSSRLDRSKLALARKQNSKSQFQSQFQQRQKNYLKSKKKVIDIFNQLGVENMKQFREILTNQSFDNENLFYEAENIYDQIFNIQANIKKLRLQNQNRETNGDKKISLRSVHLKIYASDCEKQTQKTRNQVVQFKTALQKLLSLNRDSSMSKPKKKTTFKMHKRQGTQESDKYSYAQSQESQSKKNRKPLIENQNYFTFSQNYEDIREMMTILNQKLIISSQTKEKLQEAEALQKRLKKQKNRSFIKANNPKSCARFNIKQTKDFNLNRAQTEQQQIKN